MPGWFSPLTSCSNICFIIQSHYETVTTQSQMCKQMWMWVYIVVVWILLVSQFCSKTFQSCRSLVAHWALIQKIKEFYTDLFWVAFRIVKKAEEPISAARIQGFQGEPHHTFLPNYRSQLFYLADYKDGCHRDQSCEYRVFISIRFGNRYWRYTHDKSAICSPGHSHLILLLFHRNGLRGHKSIPVATHIKGNQRGTESRHWIYQIPFRHDAQISIEPLLKFH